MLPHGLSKYSKKGKRQGGDNPNVNQAFGQRQVKEQTDETPYRA